MGFANWAAKKALNANSTVQRFGEIQNVDIDSDKRTIAVEAKLNGEVLPVCAVAEYELFANDIIIKSVKVDRAWVQPLADKFLSDRKISHKLLQNSLVQIILKFIL